MAQENVDVVHGAIHHPDRRGPQLPKKFPWENQKKDLDPVMLFMISANSQWSGMALGVSTANVSIKREWLEKVGGFDEKMSGRWDDIEFSYRLFRAGAKMYFSPLPLAHNKRVGYGGNYTHRRSVVDRLFKPAILPNKLYVYMKHFPGWMAKQLILQKLFEVYIPSQLWLTRPWNILLTPIKLLRSILIARKMLGK